MALPKEPRQKMINLMYLVLTALLALNVSAEILNAFKTVNATLENSSGLAQTKIGAIFKSFDQKLLDPNVATQDKAKIWRAKADQAKGYAEAVYKDIQAYKTQLLTEADFDPKDSSYKLDNLDVATRIFVENKKGDELLKKLTTLRTQLLGIDPDIKTAFANSLPIDLTPPKVENIAHRGDWSSSYFRMVPTVAAITILSKFQNDVRNAEAQIVEYCHKKVGEVELVYDKFQVIANATSSYMMPNEEFSIKAGIGAYSSQAIPTITVGGATATRTPDGDYELKTKAESTPGEYTKLVTVNYKDPNTGKMESVTRPIKYTVGSPSGLTVSTDKTRVFYQGLENPVSVTGSGGGEMVGLRIEGAGASVRDGERKGQFIATFTATGKVTVIATDKRNNKETKFEIPVKRVPDPLATVGGIASGSMPANRLRAQQGVIATLGDFVFEGVKFDVVSYFVMVTGPNIPEPIMDEVNGPAFSAAIRNGLNKVGSGDQLIIGNIKVRQQGSTGTSRVLPQGITILVD